MSILNMPDGAPESPGESHWFDGDLLHAEGRGSIEDGFLEFYPRVYGAQGASAHYFWFSHSKMWPPEDDPEDFPANGGRGFEIWHYGNFIFPETNDDKINYRPTHPVERFASGQTFSYTAHRRITTNSLNGQAIVLWNLSSLPADVEIEEVELVTLPPTMTSTPDESAQVPVNLNWITSHNAGPFGYPIWTGDYQHASGTAFRGLPSEMGTGPVDSLFRASTPLSNVQNIQPTSMIGLRFSYDIDPTPNPDDNVITSLSHSWVEWQEEWDRFPDGGFDEEIALSSLLCLRVHFADVTEEIITRHLARQIRAERTLLGV